MAALVTSLGESDAMVVGTDVGVFRSSNGGSSWTRLFINNNRNDSSAPFASSLTPHWLGDVEIDPFNSKHVMFVTGYGIWASRDDLVHWYFQDKGLEEIEKAFQPRRVSVTELVRGIKEPG